MDILASTVISYIHDPLGRRIAKVVDGVIVEKYLWSDRTTLFCWPSIGKTGKTGDRPRLIHLGEIPGTRMRFRGHETN